MCLNDILCHVSFDTNYIMHYNNIYQIETNKATFWLILSILNVVIELLLVLCFKYTITLIVYSVIASVFDQTCQF